MEEQAEACFNFWGVPAYSPAMVGESEQAPLRTPALILEERRLGGSCGADVAMVTEGCLLQEWVDEMKMSELCMVHAP